jgi:two-component system chemotaxis response regulator CheY
MAKVLLAEDSLVNQTVYRHILEGAEYEVIAFNNGLEAWEYLQVNAIDLLITDISMPVMDGHALLGQIRHSERYCHLPVVMLTGSGADDNELRDLASEADALLTKPSSSWELIATVDNLLRVR